MDGGVARPLTNVEDATRWLDGGISDRLKSYPGNTSSDQHSSAGKTLRKTLPEDLLGHVRWQ
jgi:hypothetical protein